MNSSLVVILLFWVFSLQPLPQFSVRVLPFFQHSKIELDAVVPLVTGDSVVFSTLKFYLGQFKFLKNGAIIFRDDRYHLVDLEIENSEIIHFELPRSLQFDSLQFNFGVDSLTVVSGAMGGDLDPTRGMFWTWQSGYIHFKIEGYSSRCTAPLGNFQFHLGGYLPPHQTVQTVKVPLGNRSLNPALRLDLTPFFENINWEKKQGIMSPCADAVFLSKLLGQSFYSDEK